MKNNYEKRNEKNNHCNISYELKGALKCTNAVSGPDSMRNGGTCLPPHFYKWLGTGAP